MRSTLKCDIMGSRTVGDDLNENKNNLYFWERSV